VKKITANERMHDMSTGSGGRNSLLILRVAENMLNN
jgi:hypothetical protein